MYSDCVKVCKTFGFPVKQIHPQFDYVHGKWNEGWTINCKFDTEREANRLQKFNKKHWFKVFKDDPFTDYTFKG